jgi:hypothetical protein
MDSTNLLALMALMGSSSNPAGTLQRKMSTACVLTSSMAIRTFRPSTIPSQGQQSNKYK